MSAIAPRGEDSSSDAETADGFNSDASCASDEPSQHKLDASCSSEELSESELAAQLDTQDHAKKTKDALSRFTLKILPRNQHDSQARVEQLQRDLNALPKCAKLNPSNNALAFASFPFDFRS